MHFKCVVCRVATDGHGFINADHRNPVCASCYDGYVMPAPVRVSFRLAVSPATTTGTCMFCSSPAAFIFPEGEFICEVCVRG